MLQTNTRTFLVKFQFSGSQGSYIFKKAKELKELLKYRQEEGDTRGIESLKVFDEKDHKFKKIAKSDFLKWADYETEAIEYFKNHPFFKSIKF